MTITVETYINDTLVDMFYGLYAKAFGPLQTRAAARHMLTAEEFAEEMADKRVEKCVAWDADGTPVALMTYTADLSAVPWISPEFYAARYPEATARGAVIYMGYTLVDRTRATPELFTELMQVLTDRVAQSDGVCVFDVCSFNDSRGVGRMADRMQGSGTIEVEVVDIQTYYAAKPIGTSTQGGVR